MKSIFPLAVDLDGTLALCDSMTDAVITTALRKPQHVPKVLRALKRGRLDFKNQLVDIDAYKPETLPLREDLIAYIRAQKAAGREVHLVTASPQVVADAVANRVGLFDSAIGSRDGVNLKAEKKAALLQERFPDGFVYAGNDIDDLEVWRVAKGAIAVGLSASVEKDLAGIGIPIEARFINEKAGLEAWLKMLRIHQWSKNVLIFVPFVLAHQWQNLEAIIPSIAAFVLMGLVASATYILNDLSDLDADRIHATKSKRPLASAAISVAVGANVSLLLCFLGFLGAVLLDPWFCLCLTAYLFLTVSYSLRLKKIALLDIFVLGLLYTLRILMGIVLLRVTPSAWLLVFALFFFFSLSMTKRHVEIVRAIELGKTGRIKGRGYFVTDAPLTLSLGISSSSVAVMLLFLYVSNDAYPIGSYKSPEWLWAITPLVFLWTTRLWLKSHRGKLDDDPINFALRDPPSLLLGSLVSIFFLLAVL